MPWFFAPFFGLNQSFMCLCLYPIFVPHTLFNVHTVSVYVQSLLIRVSPFPTFVRILGSGKVYSCSSPLYQCCTFNQCECRFFIVSTSRIFHNYITQCLMYICNTTSSNCVIYTPTIYVLLNWRKLFAKTTRLNNQLQS